MIGKDSSTNNGTKKGQINTSFGSFNLISIRNNLNPDLSFNAQTMVLLVASIVLLILSASSAKYPGVDLFLLLFAIDTLIASLLVKPFYYFKGGYEVEKLEDLKRLIINSEIPPNEIKIYSKFLIARLIIYVLMLQTTIEVFLRTNFIALQAYSYIIWSLIVSILSILFIITISMAGLGMLIDDYLNEGSSHKVWKDFRLEISNSALELDKLISRINNAQNSRINKDYRKKLAGTLFKLRNYLVIDNQPDPAYTPEMKIKFVNAEKDLTAELLSNLQKDKCVVCYSKLEGSTGPFLVCPICGQGGHKEHVEEWFETKTICPGCNSDLSSSNFLVLG